MPDLFFYGTLCHVPLLERVLGRSAAAIDLMPAQLPGWSVHWVAGQGFPMIQQQDGALTPGQWVANLSAEDLARLDHYEGGFDYSLEPMTIRTEDGAERSALVFLPAANRWTAGAPWHLPDWVAQFGDVTLEAAEEVMERFGVTSARDMDRLFPWIRARGWARCLGRRPAPSTLRRAPDASAVEIGTQRAGYDGFFRIKDFDIRYRQFDGAQSPEISRETFVAYDAAQVLPYDPVTDKVMVIEQLRFGPIWRKDPAPWVLEPIAGLVDAGEDPADCARREAVEEAGLTLGDLRLISRIYASPGYSTEFFHCYLGLCDLSDHTGGVAGLAHEAEDIRSHVISFDHAMDLVTSGEVNVGPLAMMLLWLARHREELRGAAGVRHT
ncbi:gamma-glutamylcyclotransferase [Marinovum sp. 2_MG-2023]|uniref:gamma-glutamylcyclotransferase n=1 Tax=unclassified Marinovum TaxID=2647166 RepID=UPI0026E32EF0|nr:MULTISPECIES: gamma-glutamylcyclotransferase [unclassified Marinovum]MDO6729573.1 gamma-glutamylcyclotransferase [Marinovum sp. 2_MG-2023]MDO6780273.1 gamma-glutamylcyclotransferase [Marinovum sp. 1_MG-2023]